MNIIKIIKNSIHVNKRLFALKFFRPKRKLPSCATCQLGFKINDKGVICSNMSDSNAVQKVKFIDGGWKSLKGSSFVVSINFFCINWRKKID